jgi:translation initiation factor 4E
MSLLLEHEWTAWYDQAIPGRSAKDYDKGLYTLCTINTVEDFWGCYNNMPSLLDLDPKCGFHFMLKGVKPAWEDTANKPGGIWRLKVTKEDAVCLWKEILMALVGNVYTDSLSIGINGVSVAYKQNDYFFTFWLDKDESKQNVTSYFLSLAPHIALSTEPVYQSCLFLIENTNNT